MKGLTRITGMIAVFAALILSDFVFGAAPLIVDCATGNLLRPSPRKFDLDLTRQE